MANITKSFETFAGSDTDSANPDIEPRTICHVELNVREEQEDASKQVCVFDIEVEGLVHMLRSGNQGSLAKKELKRRLESGILNH